MIAFRILFFIVTLPWYADLEALSSPIFSSIPFSVGFGFRFSSPSILTTPTNSNMKLQLLYQNSLSVTSTILCTQLLYAKEPTASTPITNHSTVQFYVNEPTPSFLLYSANAALYFVNST